MKGLFVTFEGGEGSGKSVQSKRLSAQLDSLGIANVWTKEPGGIPETVPLREMLLHSRRNLTPMAEVFLFEADRLLHVDWIYDHIERGIHVNSDRFSDSSEAYQGHGRGMPIYYIKKYNRAACLGLVPDVTYYLKVPPEVGVARALARDDKNTRFDKEGMAFHQRVSDGFDAIARENPKRVVTLDGELPIDEIGAFILQDFLNRLEGR